MLGSGATGSPTLAAGTAVTLTAPDTDPVGYVFSNWVVPGVSQQAGQKTVGFTVNAATTAVAK